MSLQKLYKNNLGLLTDLYQMTMAYGYWKTGKHQTESVFNLFFRKNPFNGGYAISCGLDYVIEYLEQFQFSQSDLNYLSSLKSQNGEQTFDDDFLKFLEGFKFLCDVDAIPEGQLVFPNEPIIRIKGPIYQCQLLETPLLNIINLQTLIATKASRVVTATKEETVIEFGLRRAHGIDGGISTSRAAYLGGCHATSNLLAGKLFDIPVRGTHAHSWVMAFSSEKEAFEKFSQAMPSNCVLLVDTYDTIEGIAHAIKIGQDLKNRGYRLLGVRLDSGDLADLSKKARKMLDDAGLNDCNIVGSNDLDEKLIETLKQQDAKINTWGVGTRLVTAYDQPALGGVYKLAAIKENGKWKDKIKLSEQNAKINIPGLQQVIRFYQEGQPRFDMIMEEADQYEPDYMMIDPYDNTKRKRIKVNEFDTEEMLKPIYTKGQLIYNTPGIHESREKTLQSLRSLEPSLKRFVNPSIYSVGLEEKLYNRRNFLIMQLRKQ